MKMSNQEYSDYVKRLSPPSKIIKNVAKSFVVGGLICCVGQAILLALTTYGMDKDSAAGWTSIIMIALGSLLTGLGVYDNIGKCAGAGTLVPITGFANAVTSPALDFKSEGYVTGMAAKMFVIAGPVIVFGISASVVYGIILVLIS